MRESQQSTTMIDGASMILPQRSSTLE